MKISLAMMLLLLVICCNVNAGEYLKKTVDISDINAVNVSGPGVITLFQGEEERLVITASKKDIDKIDVFGKDKTLYIEYYSDNQGSIFNFRNDITYELYVLDLDTVALSGSLDLIAKTDIESDTLKISASGSSDVDLMKVTAGKIDMSLSGSAKVSVASLFSDNTSIGCSGSCKVDVGYGEVDSQRIAVSGSGSYNGKNLRSQNAVINVSGAASAVVWAENSLKAKASGVSHIEYYGEPVVEESTSGPSWTKSLGGHP